MPPPEPLWAALPVNVQLVTVSGAPPVIAPPESAAELLLKEQPLTDNSTPMSSIAPPKCPLATLLEKTLLIRVVVPAPPATIAPPLCPVLPVKVLPFTVSVPPLSIPPAL